MLETANRELRIKNEENESLREELKQSKENYDSHIKKLEGEISERDVQIQRLTEELAFQGLARLSDSSCEDECRDTFAENSTYSIRTCSIRACSIRTCTPVEAEYESLQNGGAQVTSLDASHSLYPPRIRSCSDVTELKV